MKTLCTLLISLIVLGCGKTNQEESKFESQKTIRSLEEELIVSRAKLEAESILLGNIRGIATDRNGDIYTLDVDNKSIFRFNTNGDFIEEFEIPSGRGPGELLSPNSLYVDSLGYKYVTDRDERKLLILDADGEFHSNLFFKMMPARVVAQGPEEIYAIGFRFTYQDSGIVLRYTYKDDEYKLTDSFGKRTSSEFEMLINMSGYSDFIITESRNIILNRFYPYKLEVYNSNLEKIGEVQKTKEEFKPPYRKDGLIRMDAVGREVLVLNEFNIVRYLSNGESYFDFYDKTWNYLETKDYRTLGIEKEGKYFASIPNTNQFVVLYQNAETKIKKYTVSL